MTNRADLAAIAEAIDGALSDVPEHLLVPVPMPETAPPLRSLSAECEALLSAAPRQPPVRIVQHFACTGGTLIARALAVQPNVTLLSEIDPLSTMSVRRNNPGFAPTDIIYGLRHALRQVDNPVLADMFMASLEVLHAHVEEQGLNLVLRDHTHSQYCVQSDPASRPSLHDLVSRRLRSLAVVTVRHPLDSFVSLATLGWHNDMDPATLETYCQRYLAFLAENRDAPLFRYEDFTANPSKVLEQICAALELDYSEESLTLLAAARLSGDSGRSSNEIVQRPRREVPDWIESERQNSESYRTLCAALGYPES